MGTTNKRGKKAVSTAKRRGANSEELRLAKYAQRRSRLCKLYGLMLVAVIPVLIWGDKNIRPVLMLSLR